MVLGYFRTKPQAVAHHVGIGDGLQRLGAADIHIATHDHGMQVVWCTVQDTLVEGHLQGQQILRKLLSTLPSENGHGCEHLARRSIGGQPSALPSGMEQQFLVFGQPFFKAHAVAPRLITGIQ